ncbi:MAG: FTR1 family protein [Candidatus Binatia bacterium]
MSFIIPGTMCRRFFALVSLQLAATTMAALTASALLPTAVVPAASREETRRLLTMLAAIGEEYREGVRDGSVVRPVELEEAKSFLAEAEARLRDVATHLPPPASDEDLAPLFEEIAAAMDAKAPLETVSAGLAAVRERVVALTGVSARVYPPAAPSVARGRVLFGQYCAKCHGVRGDGKGPDAAGLHPPPANFTDAQFMRGETPYDFYHVVSLGKRRTAMPAWDGALSVQDRWDVVSFVWTLAPGAAGLVEGQGVYLAHCASCHGATGNGLDARFARILSKPPPDMSRPQALARQTDAELFAAATHGVAGTAMPPFDRVLGADERWKAVAFMRVLSLGGPETVPSSGGRSGVKSKRVAGPSVADAALRESAGLLDAAVAAYGREPGQAANAAADAYFQFEPVEQQLGAIDPGLKSRVETGFLHLRQKLRGPGNGTEVRALAAAIHADLDAVRIALQPRPSPYGLFVQSATIILREGFEIVLVIGALLAYVVKTGNRAMRRSIYSGTVIGVGASIATAFVMEALLQLHPGSSDALEGVTMMLAAVVLFWVSYWLTSKAEADRWQRYIRGKVQTALSGGRSIALAGVAFLAVYREGFEMVLFYQALYASAPGGAVTVSAGCLAGGMALAVVYALFRHFQVRIPVGRFFFVTGLLLYGMAAIFAGQGMHELQEAGIIRLTPVSGVPVLPLLGIYPAAESLLLQTVFVVLLLYATFVTLRRAHQAAERGRADDVSSAVRALQSAIDALRQDLAASRSGGSPLAASLGARVEGVLVRVEELASRVQPSAPVPTPTNGEAVAHRRASLRRRTRPAVHRGDRAPT